MSSFLKLFFDWKITKLRTLIGIKKLKTNTHNLNQDKNNIEKRNKFY